MRTLTGSELRPSETSAREALEARDPADDFFCLRYGVWYPSIDCAFRTYHATCDGCLDCVQGRFNLKRHREVLLRTRPVGRMR